MNPGTTNREAAGQPAAGAPPNADTSARDQGPRLSRFDNNPILLPRPDHRWESRYVFNPAAIHLGGRTHLIYRAIGEDGLSVLGYATSTDGNTIDERLHQPVYQCTQPFYSDPDRMASAPYPYASGGSWSGCEDPRLTQVEDTIYMTYTSFGGWDIPPCMALTSIPVDEFLAHKWNWRRPTLMSPPYQIAKNWIIFPEKFNGRYAILHSIAPKILIDYVDSPENLENEAIQSHYYPHGNADDWDNWIRGAGAPPIRTRAGWLLLYHAMDKRDPNRYKLGAMLLDGDDPTTVIARLPYPLLEPNARYENEGFKPGVIYNCGAVVLGDRLLVYYGGADAVVCGAEISLESLLQRLEQAA